MLSMRALKCTTHLLPLFRPLRFIINACNKYVTLALIVINENDDPRLFLDFSCMNGDILDFFFYELESQ